MQDIVRPLAHDQFLLVVEESQHFTVLLQLVAERFNQLLQCTNHLGHSILPCKFVCVGVGCSTGGSTTTFPNLTLIGRSAMPMPVNDGWIQPKLSPPAHKSRGVG